MISSALDKAKTKELQVVNEFVVFHEKTDYRYLWFLLKQQLMFADRNFIHSSLFTAKVLSDSTATCDTSVFPKPSMI